MPEETRGQLTSRIGSLVNALGNLTLISRRRTLTTPIDEGKTYPLYAVLTRTVWSDEGSRELLGWQYEAVDVGGQKTTIQVHMVDHVVKYLVIEYTVTSARGNELDYRVTWAEGLQDAQVTVALLLNLEHVNQVAFE